MRKSFLKIITFSAALGAGFSVFPVQAGVFPDHHTKSWYMDHTDVMKKRAEMCKDDAALMSDPDCRNAINADSQLYALGKPEKNQDTAKPLPMPPNIMGCDMQTISCQASNQSLADRHITHITTREEMFEELRSKAKKSY